MLWKKERKEEKKRVFTDDGRLPWITWIVSKDTHMCPSERDKESDTHTEGEKLDLRKIRIFLP